ncbi:MAG: glycosyl hydrolase family 39 [Proteobacteria bacterium]|nr:glycosyl hydrolase family 39 [Pseudomonadota bacterium]
MSSVALHSMTTWLTGVMIGAMVVANSALAVVPVMATPEDVSIDAQAAAHPFPHYWEHMFGSGRAILSLRESWRDDLRTVSSVTSAAYVRFHGILNDEVGVYTEGPNGESVYNFSYVDQIYDGLLANGVRPIVELSFMPAKLAQAETRHSFWYRPVIAPPKDYGRWDGLITALARHLVDRYGIGEVSQWYFEVWNEPNLDFWAGEPKQSTYWALYEHTARRLKEVDARLRVGGPATAQAAWITEFIRHCKEQGIPLDFVSTHVYGDDPPEGVFGSKAPVPRREMVCRAVDKVHAEIKASPLPDLPLLMTEFNATFLNRSEITDAPFMGPWLAETISRCDGLVQEMSYWALSDVFEEAGVVQRPFYGGYGLIAAGHISKPALNALALLHRLGEERIPSAVPQSLLTRRKDGALVVALWNYTDVDTAGVPRTVRLQFTNTRSHTAMVERVDREHGNALLEYARLGAPRYPTRAELARLRSAASMTLPTSMPLTGTSLTLTVPPHGLVLITLAAARDKRAL